MHLVPFIVSIPHGLNFIDNLLRLPGLIVFHFQLVKALLFLQGLQIVPDGFFLLVPLSLNLCTQSAESGFCCLFEGLALILLYYYISFVVVHVLVALFDATLQMLFGLLQIHQMIVFSRSAEAKYHLFGNAILHYIDAVLIFLFGLLSPYKLFFAINFNLFR